MLTYHLQKDGAAPLYDKLYQAIRDDILKGNIKAGEKLPSKRNFAANQSISVTTVENAYNQLLMEGYIHSRAGSGFYVNDISAQSRRSAKSIPIYRQEMPLILEEPEQQEKPYRIDFKANRTALSLFPYSTWSKLIRSTLSEQNPDLLKTVPFNGIYTLRKTIADYLLQSKNMKVSPAQIIIGAGTEYLYSRLIQLLGHDTIFAIEDPGYKKFAEISNSQDVLWDYIPIDDDGLRIDRLRKRQANIVHVSPANHFPTGIVMPIHRRIELLEWSYEDSSRYIIEDDYDSELRYSGRSILPLFTLDQQDRVIYLNTFSKSLVPSLRISYMILPPILLERYRKMLSFYSCTVSSFEQITLARFISDGYFDRHLNRLKQHYREKRDQLIAAIHASRLNDISTIREADGGTHFLLCVNTRLTDADIKENAEAEKIHFDLLSDYERFPTLKNSGTLVINYAGLNPDQIPLAVQLLENVFFN